MKRARKKILVIDDTEATRYAVARTLNAEGYEILEASTGTSGLAMVHREKPDLVTLDIHLPDIIGFEVCRRIKNNPVTAHIPVLQVSASYVTSKDRIHGLEGGADSYLTHPFEPPVLVATVKALLRTSSVLEDLRLSEERFRVALKYAPITIFTVGMDLRYNWIYNCPAGMVPSDFIGRRDEVIFPAGEAALMVAAKYEVLRSGNGQRLLTPLTLNEEIHHYDLTIEPLRSMDGEIEGLTVAGIDVTERMRAEEAQKRAFEAAEQSNRAKSRFLSNMSHEIRTPLGVIQGFAELASESGLSDDERGEYLDTVKRNAGNVTKLLGEILDMAKIEAGKIELEKSRFRVRELVDEVVSALRMQAVEKGVALDFTPEEPFPDFIHSDCTRLRQILINLVSNAIKFTERGRILVEGRALPPVLDGGPSRIEFTVSDSGIGLSPEQQRRLFEPFMQADSSTTRRFGGTGLGLNLSKKLAEVLGGGLTLESSAEGRGSTFRFNIEAGILNANDFGADAARADDGTARAAFFAGKLRGLRVLLVEDSLDNQVLFKHYLKIMGALTEIAGDGAEGVTKAKAGNFDAILMDVQMPNVDGYDATRMLRESGMTLPIIALTAHAFREERDRALAQGFTAYLTKPLTPVLLFQTLRPYLRD